MFEFFGVGTIDNAISRLVFGTKIREFWLRIAVSKQALPPQRHKKQSASFPR